MTPTPTSAQQESPRFFCHECSVNVEARVDEASEEDDPPQNFRADLVEETHTQTETPETSTEVDARTEIRNEFGGTRPLPR
ncbi:hypothetical protein KXD40_001801 [Peronospora effusa]|nr:hypothetical protein KXD40_001801 [Peronospora effusa]